MGFHEEMLEMLVVVATIGGGGRVWVLQIEGVSDHEHGAGYNSKLVSLEHSSSWLGGSKDLGVSHYGKYTRLECIPVILHLLLIEANSNFVLLLVLKLTGNFSSLGSSFIPSNFSMNLFSNMRRWVSLEWRVWLTTAWPWLWDWFSTRILGFAFLVLN